MKFNRVGALVSALLAAFGSTMVIASPTAAAPVTIPPPVRVCVPAKPTTPLPALTSMTDYFYTDGMLFISPIGAQTLCSLLTGNAKVALHGGRVHVKFRQCGDLGVSGQPVPPRTVACMRANVALARGLRVLTDNKTPQATALLWSTMLRNGDELARVVRDLLSNQHIQIIAPSSRNESPQIVVLTPIFP